MLKIHNDRFLRALARQPVDKTPIWIMRQAGRYLPEYRALRQRYDFMTVCKTPELACEVALQPLARFDLDAAIVFSDILTIPDAMGLGLFFEENKGPQFTKPLSTLQDIKNLYIPDMSSDLGYVGDAVALLVKELKNKIPVIGFAGSPWTLASYMVEGASTREFKKIKKLMFTEPKFLHQLLKILADSIVHYLAMQIKAGASAVMIFDSWGGVLSAPAYLEFSLEYMNFIIQDLKIFLDKNKIKQTPIILFTKGNGQCLESMASTGCDAISLDWTVDIGRARQLVGDRVALQGNMDPQVLYASPQRICEEVALILKSYGPGPGHIFNLGHGIAPDVDPERVKVLVDAVHDLG